MDKYNEFLARVDALGDNPTQAQADQLESWMIDNNPRTRWADAAVDAMHVGDLYTNMRMRMAACGVW